MSLEIQLAIAITNIMKLALERIAKDPKMVESLLDKAQSVDDWLQVKLNRVSQPNTIESIQLAMNTSIVRDQETICSIIAMITTLYATQNVVRGANVGGTLLENFGSDVFPHIHKRELRYAKPVDEKTYDYLVGVIHETFPEEIKKYDFKKHADFSDIGPGCSSWATISCVSVHGLTKILLDYGPVALAAIKSFLNIKSA